MASNRTVTYIDMGLNSVSDFWRENVAPNAREFSQAPTTRLAIQAATATWHLNEWVWHDRNPGQDTRNNPAYAIFRQGMVAACPELGWLGDVTDAGKHRGLGRMPEVAEAKPRTVGGGGGMLLLGVGGGGRLLFTLVLNDGSHLDFAEVLARAIGYWRSILSADHELEDPYG